MRQPGVHSNDVVPSSNLFEYTYLVQGTKSSDQLAHFLPSAFSILNHIVLFLIKKFQILT